MTILPISIFLMMVAYFVIRACISWVSNQSALAARDRWELITGFVIAVTAFAIVSLPLAEVVVPGVIWFVGIGLLASGVGGAALRWPDLAWYAGTKPFWRATGVIAALCICGLIIGVAIV